MGGRWDDQGVGEQEELAFVGSGAKYGTSASAWGSGETGCIALSGIDVTDSMDTRSSHRHTKDRTIAD